MRRRTLLKGLLAIPLAWLVPKSWGPVPAREVFFRLSWASTVLAEATVTLQNDEVLQLAQVMGQADLPPDIRWFKVD